MKQSIFGDVAGVERADVIFHGDRFVPWQDASFHMLEHSMHYGTAAFEGVRSYQTARGPAIFRLRDHMERLHYSVSPLRMELPYTVDALCELTVELVRRNGVGDSYIRPLAFFENGGMGLKPASFEGAVSIACWPRGAYSSLEALDIKISSVQRIHPDSTVVDAKLTAHYLNSVLASLEIKGTHYHDALLLDCDGFVAEGPGANFFMVRDGTLLTPSTGNIVVGITRATIMELARDRGYEVRECPLTEWDVMAADEAFYTGTAAEVLPIRSINDRVLGNGGIGDVTKELKSLYQRVVRGEESRYEHYLTYVTECFEHAPESSCNASLT